MSNNTNILNIYNNLVDNLSPQQKISIEKKEKSESTTDARHTVDLITVVRSVSLI